MASAATALARGDNFAPPLVVLTTAAVAQAPTSPGDVVASTAFVDETRGHSWQECEVWYPSMPGSFFQVFCVGLYLAFWGCGKSPFTALYTHALGAFSFFFLAVWAVFDACSADLAIWGLVLCLVNVGQIVYIKLESKKMEKVFDSDMQTMYNMRFAPFEISKQVFAELVTCKGCDIFTLSKGHNYSAEGKTPVDRLSFLIAGRARVCQDNKVLHNIKPNDFIDSSEWEALKASSSARETYKVTITAETDCKYISWKRKPLLALLTKRKRLGKLVGHMIGRDVVNKLYHLNNVHFNHRGYRYDIRLPLIMSLRDDVMERQKRKKDQLVGLESPGEQVTSIEKPCESSA